MPTPVSPNAAFNNALESRRAHLLSLDAASLRIIRVDPVVIVNASIGAAPRLEKFREELVARFGTEATELLDALRPAALALKQADADFDGLTEGNALPPIHQELLAKHAVMLKDAESLVLRGHLPADALTNAREVRGYQATIDSTMVLLSVLRRNWATIGGITPITEQDLADIEAVALRLTDALATRDQASLRGPAYDLRLRAINDAFRTYDQLRRMMTFLRWDEGDVDQILPSLFVGRGRKPSDVAAEPTDPTGPFTPIVEPFEPAPIEPATPSPNNGGPAFEA